MRCDADALEAEPLRHQAQLRVERFGDGAAVDALLAVSRAHLQCRAGSIGFETEPSSEAVTEEEGKHVVAVHALGCRRVDLQPIAEIEDPLGARTPPDQRVKRCEQRAGLIRRGIVAEASRKASLDQPFTATFVRTPLSTSSATARRVSARGRRK